MVSKHITSQKHISLVSNQLYRDKQAVKSKISKSVQFYQSETSSIHQAVGLQLINHRNKDPVSNS